MAKPRIQNVRWRGSVAWARIKKGGQVFEQSLETENPAVARERVEKLRKELEATRWGAKPRRTFDEAAAKFIDDHLPRLRPRTREGYLQALNKLADVFEGRTLDEIGSGLLSEYENKRRGDGVQGEEIIRGLRQQPMYVGSHEAAYAYIRELEAMLQAMDAAWTAGPQAGADPMVPLMERAEQLLQKSK